MYRRHLVARLTQSISRRASGPLDRPEYPSRRHRRGRQRRLARLLPGRPALVEDGETAPLAVAPEACRAYFQAD